MGGAGGVGVLELHLTPGGRHLGGSVRWQVGGLVTGDKLASGRWDRWQVGGQVGHVAGGGASGRWGARWQVVRFGNTS